MGHWADELLPEVKARLKIRGNVEDEGLLRNLRRAQGEIELLAGRRFGVLETAERHFESGGLPFLDVPDLRVDSMEPTAHAWPIVDPVHPDLATVLQVAVPARLADNSVPVGEALWAAGQLVGVWSANDWPRGATLLWLKSQIDGRGFKGLVRRLLEPNRFVYVPIASALVNGWWIQLSRRLLLLTSESPEDPLLYEFLAPFGDWGALLAAEPRLIVARLTEHPANWAMVARIWRPTERTPARPWRHLADAVHRHGLPVLAVDDQTTPVEAAAHLLLVAGWHGYLTRNDDLVPSALALAYPREVAALQRGTGAPSVQVAATLLWERLLRPGFDPLRSAESVRRYIRRQASTLVKAHRSAQAPDPPWQRLGISERYYYKLLGRFSSKSLEGRYEIDQQVHDRIRNYLDEREVTGDRQRSKIELLRLHGFTDVAARKWLQRHSVDDLRSAWPRRRRQ